MTAFTISEHRRFMALLLTRPAFDRWSISEGSVTTFCTFSIEGAWQRSFLDPNGTNPDACRSYAPWGMLREHCLSLIRGKQVPLSFKFVLRYPEEDLPAFLAENDLNMASGDINGLYMNISFRNGVLITTTGSSLKTFSMDKTLDHAWDSFTARFLEMNGIGFERA
ncbi:MAG: DUF5721 family protein [Lachnospiraceae bacterium]|nr:DUF5721 family protein [Lachnospiraceae bacterium]